MKLTRISAAVGCITLAALASPAAIAQDSGWYGGANVGQSRATIDDARIRSGLLSPGFTSVTIADDNRSTDFKIFGGYQLNNNFALEGGYFDLGRFGYTATTVPAGTLNGSMKVRGLNLDVVGTLPLSERFSVFGRAGINYAQTKDHFSSTGAVTVTNPNPSERGANYKIGAGLQYAITDALSIRGELERYRVKDGVGNRGHIDMASVGLIYRFGAKPQQPVTQAAYVPPMVQPAPAPVAVLPPPPAPMPPPPPPPRIEKYTLSATELFAFDSSTLQGNQPKLDEVAAALRQNGGVQNVVITGYTDRIGSVGYNQKLSERRAAAVKTYLVGKGVEANRLSAQGKGEADPVVMCSDKALPALIKCLEPNRRVEVERITVERRLP